MVQPPNYYIIIMQATLCITAITLITLQTLQYLFVDCRNGIHLYGQSLLLCDILSVVVFLRDLVVSRTAKSAYFTVNKEELATSLWHWCFGWLVKIWKNTPS